MHNIYQSFPYNWQQISFYLKSQFVRVHLYFLISKISYQVLNFYVLQQPLPPYALQPHYPSPYKGSGSGSFQHLLHQQHNEDNNGCD